MQSHAYKCMHWKPLKSPLFHKLKSGHPNYIHHKIYMKQIFLATNIVYVNKYHLGVQRTHRRVCSRQTSHVVVCFLTYARYRRGTTRQSAE